MISAEETLRTQRALSFSYGQKKISLWLMGVSAMFIIGGLILAFLGQVGFREAFTPLILVTTACLLHTQARARIRELESTLGITAS